MVYDYWISETILDSFLRHGVRFNYSCRENICLGRMMRTTAGLVPKATQAGIDKSLNAEGYFLPCLCRPMQDLTLDSPRQRKCMPGP